MSRLLEMREDVGVVARCIATPDVAGGLDDAVIHVWWLSRTRSEGRAPLMHVLAAYLNVPMESVTLRAGAHGRPELAGRFAGRLHFNWSHSGERAVLAVARKLPRLGVDIEYLSQRHSYMRLAQHYFGADEYASLTAMPSAERAAGFVRLWTAKEAILKADGRGLAHGLDKVRFTIRDGSVQLQQLDGTGLDSAGWRFAHWRVSGTGFATLCWHGQTRVIRHFTPTSRRSIRTSDEFISQPG